MTWALNKRLRAEPDGEVDVFLSPHPTTFDPPLASRPKSGYAVPRGDFHYSPGLR